MGVSRLTLSFFNDSNYAVFPDGLFIANFALHWKVFLNIKVTFSLSAWSLCLFLLCRLIIYDCNMLNVEIISPLDHLISWPDMPNSDFFSLYILIFQTIYSCFAISKFSSICLSFKKCGTHNQVRNNEFSLVKVTVWHNITLAFHVMLTQYSCVVLIHYHPHCSNIFSLYTLWLIETRKVSNVHCR